MMFSIMTNLKNEDDIQKLVTEVRGIEASEFPPMPEYDETDSVPFEMPEMNAMMAEDVSEPSLRSLRSREKAVSTPKKTGMGGLWNENFERMFSRR